jgi:ADP-ribose pyrophosphatase YjhB (NUDIX family)
MNESDQKKLVKLLKNLKKEKMYPPNMPFEIWRAIQDLVPTPTAEVIITRTGKDFLLVERRDKFWGGWHIPGGFMAMGESSETACNRFSQKDLGIKVKFEKIVHVHAWTDHPYGHPLSLVCVCKPIGEPEAGEYFTKIPSPMIPHHGDFIKAFLKSS